MFYFGGRTENAAALIPLCPYQLRPKFPPQVLHILMLRFLPLPFLVIPKDENVGKNH